nr:LysE family translocator [Fusobacteriaceae bacterium]
GFIPFLILGFTFIITGTLWGLILSFSSSIMTNAMKKNRNISSKLNKITGIVFITLGIKLLNTHNK